MDPKLRRRILIALQALGILLGLFMLATRGHATERSDEQIDVAVLKNRADAIDRHLVTTDSTAEHLWNQVNSLEKDMSEMHGEERVAWGVITLLCGGSLVIQFRTKKGP